MFSFSIKSPEIVAAIASASSQVVTALGKVETQLIAQNQIAREQLKVLQRSHKLLRWSFVPEGKFLVTLESENMDKLKYSVLFNAPSDPDVVKRVLKVSVDGALQSTAEFSPGASDLGFVEVPQNSQVHLGVVDVDDAGNESGEVGNDFQALDTLAPGLVGNFNVQLVSESEEVTTQPPVVEEPPPAEETTTPAPETTPPPVVEEPPPAEETTTQPPVVEEPPSPPSPPDDAAPPEQQ